MHCDPVIIPRDSREEQIVLGKLFSIHFDFIFHALVTFIMHLLINEIC